MIIFLTNGETLKFVRVENVITTSKRLTFTYVSVSTGEHKYAEFNLDVIAGYSLNEESE